MFLINLLRHLMKCQPKQKCYHLEKRNTASSATITTTTTTITTTTTTAKKDAKLLTADVILSEENRKRCIKCMLQSPPIGVKLNKKGVEQIFAAVLIALCTNKQNEISLLYTRRSSTLSRHMRQISFPGGLRDATDENFIECALRETEEEIGLPRQRIKIWGSGNLVTPPNTAAIMPIIGVVENLNIQDLHINQHEVEEVFTIPLAKLADPTKLHYTQFKSGYSSPLFLVEQYRIWGVTGFLTNNFLNCLLPEDLNKIKNRVQYIRPYRKSTKTTVT